MSDHSPVILINKTFKGNPVCQYLIEKFQTIRYLDVIPCDILFPSIQPSLSVKLLEEAKSESEFQIQIEILNAYQEKFRYCFAIIHSSNHMYWDKLNINLKSGTLRLLQSPHEQQEIANMIFELYKAFQNNCSEQQDKYFADSEKRILTRNTALDVIHQLFDKLEISKTEQDLIVEGLSSISNIIQADEETFKKISPVEIQTIQKIIKFFK